MGGWTRAAKSHNQDISLSICASATSSAPLRWARAEEPRAWLEPGLWPSSAPPSAKELGERTLKWDQPDVVFRKGRLQMFLQEAPQVGKKGINMLVTPWKAACFSVLTILVSCACISLKAAAWQTFVE